MDYILVVAYILAGLLAPCRNTALACTAFCFSVVYADTIFWSQHSAHVNHLVVILIYFPFVLFARGKTALAMIAYMALHWLVGFDHLISRNLSVINQTFVVSSTLLNLVIIALSVGSSSGGLCRGRASLFNCRLVNIWRIQTHCQANRGRSGRC